MTHVAIDDQLLADAQKIGGQRTRKATVHEALREYIQRRQTNILALFGTIEYDPNYDCTKQRRRS